MGVGHKLQQQGFTLLEVMIAAIVLSIGLLGVFQLHIFAKRSSYASVNYSQATMMAADMADRIRLNPSQRGGYAFSNYGNGTITLPTITCNNSSGSINQCTPTQMAAWDQYLWDQLLSGSSERIGSTNVGVAADLVGCVFVSGVNVEVVISWQGLLSSKDAAVNYSQNAQSCGTQSSKRRMVVLNSVVSDNL